MKERKSSTGRKNVPDYQEGIFELDRLIEQMENGIQVLREVNRALLDRLQELHPEWKYRVIQGESGYQIAERDTGKVLTVKGKPLTHSRAREILRRQRKLEQEDREKQRRKKLEKEVGEPAAMPVLPVPKAPGKHSSKRIDP